MPIDRRNVFVTLLAFLVVLISATSAQAATFTIGGTVSGLTSGKSVTLHDNGTDSLTVTVNGSFKFKTALATGAKYAVTIATQPVGETCTVTGGSGTVGTSNVTTVKVVCAKTYTIGGTVSGLSTGTSVTLLDNGTDSLKVAANGTFTFKTALASAKTYKVTVSVQPTGETCTVTGGSGTVGTASVTTVKVACAAAKTYTIGGTVSGLSSGKSVTLLDNGTDSLTVAANGGFTFKTALASGAKYSVTVGTEPTGETCTVSNGSGTVGTANVTSVAVACSSGGGGGSGAYWIPFSAKPIPNVTPVGKNGLFLIPSDKLSSSPAPTWVTTDATQLLAVGTKITVSSGVLTYLPQVLMYGDTDSTGTTRIFGLNLAGTSTVPTPTQISNLALPSGQQICSYGSTIGTDVSQPTTLFVVLQVGTLTQCYSSGGTFEVVHYTDSKTTAPVVVNINSTDMSSVYQGGKLVGLLLYSSTTKSLDLYANDTFTSPTEKITGLASASSLRGVLDEATLSTSGIFFEVTTSANVNELWRIDGATLAATEIQNLGTGTISSGLPQDDTNAYYIVQTPGASNTVTDAFYQVALTGGTPKLLYTPPSFVWYSTTGSEQYQLIGSNDSVLAFNLQTDTFTSGSPDPTKATATIYTIPVGTSTTTPTKLASYGTGNQLLYSFLATPSGGDYSSSVLFATVKNATGTSPNFNYAYSAVSMPLNGSGGPAPIAKSVYAPLAVLSSRLTDSVWQVTGITDTNGAFGGGTANLVNVSGLVATPFTTTGGGHYVFSAGFSAALEAIASNNTTVGIIYKSVGSTTQYDGAAADLTGHFLLQISLTNTEIIPY